MKTFKLFGIAAATCCLVAFAPVAQGAGDDFEKCTSAAGCSLQKSFRVMQDIQAKSVQGLAHIQELCKEMNYIGCLGPQQDEISAWQQDQERLLALMKKVEAAPVDVKGNIAQTQDKP